ncbi:serine/threonine-protein kinase WAG1 [Dioscorea cayenensis subsp. rotundata]|uniref:non-specific serine/threonine protein kinase n=1 Tax=Dioscorea cayennensis subsp. rotundata TaxID=55577 RepID=A0AB40CNA4_DIOCR|nr:serine/threonine-protein kinase WAG1 [Dioscorea cayenensis subsp. rotundata]
MEDQEPPPSSSPSPLPYISDLSDLDHSFTSSTTFTSSSSARSSLSLSFPLSSSSTSLSLSPHPHSSSNPLWSSLRATTSLSPDNQLHLHHLHLIRPLGSGDLARVFHCRLRHFPNSDFALKVIDLDSSSSKPRLSHVQTESLVLSSLDHPFLPTLFARLDASHFSCFLIDYCPSGDLHSLLRRLPLHRLHLPSARFFSSEVLLALEYLHSLGFVYRDLKPENVLLRADGHIMLSDFDLCFHSPVQPQLLPTDNNNNELEFVAEPDTAFSTACVGTHEYLAPEIVSGGGHGNGVDWWAFGVFLYEMFYGRTPFKGRTKEETLRNIVGKEVSFPEEKKEEMAPARDLIMRLLVKDPKMRLGCRRGAADIKKHPFFHGVKWALIRSSPPPEHGGDGVGRKKSGWWRVSRWFRKKISKSRRFMV